MLPDLVSMLVIDSENPDGILLLSYPILSPSEPASKYLKSIDGSKRMVNILLAVFPHVGT